MSGAGDRQPPLGTALPSPPPQPPGGSARRGPGYGTPHPQLVALLGSLAPAVVERIVWPGNVVVDVAAYPTLTPAPVPPELVTLVRCIVRVGDRIVACQSPDMWHVWPGGRRLPGEAYETTARREVYEETGWLIDETDLRPLGFLHFRYAEPQPAGHPYPHPDFLQVVYTARAKGREGSGSDWTDHDGWERSHRLCTMADLGGLDLSAVQHAFLSRL